MKKRTPKTEIRIRHCEKCCNNCPLDKPVCQTGRDLAAGGDLYETVVIEEKTLLQKFRDRMHSIMN